MTSRPADRALFLDWCTATDQDPGAARWGDVVQFLVDCPTTEPNRRRRAAAALDVCVQAGNPLHDPDRAEPGPALARDSGWLPVLEALDRTPLDGTRGVAGRRDSFVLITAGLGFTRRDIRSMTGSDITWKDQDGVSIRGRHAGRGRDAHSCPSCRVWLWAYSVTRGGLSADPPGVRGHWCTMSLPALQRSELMATSVDPGGRVTVTEALTARSLSRILRYRLDPDRPPLAQEHRTAPLEAATASPSTDSPFRRTRHDELDELNVELDARIDELDHDVQRTVAALLEQAEQVAKLARGNQ